jgi:hypothetical protein
MVGAYKALQKHVWYRIWNLQSIFNNFLVYVEIISPLFYFFYFCHSAVIQKKWPQALCDTHNSMMFVLYSSRVRLVSQNFKEFHGSFVQRVTLTLSLSVRQLKDLGSVSLENFSFISCTFAELERNDKSLICISFYRQYFIILRKFLLSSITYMNWVASD